MRTMPNQNLNITLTNKRNFHTHIHTYWPLRHNQGVVAERQELEDSDKKHHHVLPFSSHM